MATYKVMLTVKDRYGYTKELDSGTVSISQDKLTEEDLTEIKEAIPVYKPNLTADNMLQYTLTHGETEEHLEFDIDKSNDWNEIDSTAGSSYIWEEM